MQSARTLIHRTASMAMARSSSRTVIATRSYSTAITRRCLSGAAAHKVQEETFARSKANVNFVREAINKMLSKGEAEVKPISNQELEQSLAVFAHRFQEARACINDCTEARAGSLEFYEELYTAQKAVDGAFNCYVDLLDDFRRASDEQLKGLCQDRLELANALKSLRAELHQLAEPKQNSVA